MRALTATITVNAPLHGRLSRLSLSADGLSSAQPGQWVSLSRPDSRSILAHPYPITAIDQAHRSIDLLYEHEAGSAVAPWHTMPPVGSAITALGPWGRPFPRDRQARHAVLAGAGQRLLTLLALATALIDSGVAVVVVHDAATGAEAIPPALLPSAVEYQLATADGSAGQRGTLLDLMPPLLPWADLLYAALAPHDYPALRDLVHRHRLRARRGFATVVAEAPLACYSGACDGCSVPLRDGYGLLCKDGPAFDLLQLR